MQDRIKTNDAATVGGQPPEDQFAELARSGFKTIMSLRTAGEPEQPLLPEAEGRRCGRSGWPACTSPSPRRT